MRLRSRGLGDPAGRRALRAGCLLAALAWPAIAAPPRPLPDYRWSLDGTVLAAVERRARAVTAVRLVDGATGAVRGTLDGSLLAAAAGRETVRTDIEVGIAPGGARAVLAIEDRAVLWTPASGEVAPLEALAGRGAATARLSPDGERVAYLDGSGNLWALELAARRALQLTRDVAVGSELAWSPDGRMLAYPARDAAGRLFVAVVEVEDPAPRRLETEAFGTPGALRWRFDAGAVGVVTRAADNSRLELLLCHSLRSHCRPLARREWRGGRAGVDDLRFLADGFLWGPADGGGELAFFDTLGRQRRELLSAGHRLLGIAALFTATQEVAVVSELAAEPGIVRLSLVDVRRGTRREIATGTAWPAAAISEALRAWVRPRRTAASAVDGYLLERIDGTPILAFALSGAPAAP
ncbi:MAG TPA: hypothetical protein VGC00_04180 [Thermoanaerobaculia bacterium]